MSGEYFSIGKVCGPRANLKALIFSDMTNVDNYGPEYLPPSPNTPVQFKDINKVYSIAGERYSAGFSAESSTYQGGDYSVGTISMHVPKTRAAMDLLLRRMTNRLLCVIGIDYHGTQHVLYDARRSYSKGTGDRPGSKHGYNLRFNAPCHYLLPSIAGDGDIESAPPIGGLGPGSTSDSDCCITINPVNIAYTPAASGNAFNHHQLVTTISGALYFIDGDGRGILIKPADPMVYVYDVPEGSVAVSVAIPGRYPLPDPDDYPSPTYDVREEISLRMAVKLGSRWIDYEAPDDDSDGWFIDFGSRNVYFRTSIDGARLEFYFYQDIKPRIL